MRNDTIEIRPISGALGAEIRGIDLSRPLGDEDHGTIRQTLAARGVVFFRDQSLAPAQHLMLAERDGGGIGNLELATQDAVHPVVIMRLRKALYLDPRFTLRFEGWIEEES